MHCPMADTRQTETLLAYVSGRLASPAALEIEQHAADCAACAAFLKEQKAVWEALDSWKAPAVSAGFDQGLYRRIEQAEDGGWWSRLRPGWRVPFPRRTLAVAAACAVVLVAVLLQPHAKIIAPGEARGEKLDIEQLEKTLEDLDMLQQLNLGSKTQPEAPPSKQG